MWGTVNSFYHRSGATLHGLFQIRGDDLAKKVLLAACDQEIELANYRKICLKSRPLSDVIIEENQRLKEDKIRSFSAELRSLVHFVLDRIYMKVDTPNYEAVSGHVHRDLEYFPWWPIIRKRVQFKRDAINAEARDARAAQTYFDRIKEMEKHEFESSGIECQNDHAALRGVTPGLFIFSCIHRIIHGTTLSLV